MFTVLFVDDNRNVREFWKCELEKEDYRVLLAADGYEALDALQREPPDVAVLDFHMPRVGGAEVIRWMAGQNCDIPVILYTAQRDFAHGDFGWPVKAYVEKSDNPSALKSAVARAVKPYRSVPLVPVQPQPTGETFGKAE